MKNKWDALSESDLSEVRRCLSECHIELDTTPTINVTIDYANVAGTINDLKGAGGRLLMVIGKDDSLQKARDHVYDYLRQLDEPECFYRHDIGAKAGLQ